MTSSPYRNVKPENWLKITNRLLNKFPLVQNDIVNIVLESWDDIFCSKIGAKKYILGRDICPQPQIMSFFLHEMIPLNLAFRFPDIWKRGEGSEFDAVYMPDDKYSFEIKASSSTKDIYGNRSYTKTGENPQKRRSGYFLAINFDKFHDTALKPGITLVRFGWLDADDWIGQKAASGQRSRLTKEAKAYKLIVLMDKSGKR